MIRSHLKTTFYTAAVIFISIKFSFIYSVLGIKPDLVLILLIRRALHDPNPQTSLAWGFFAGLVIDATVGDVLGVSSLSYSVVSFFVSYYKRDSAYTPSYKRTLLYIYSILFSSFIIYSVTISYSPFLKNLLFLIIPSAVYTMAVAVIFQTIKPTR